ncbi:MAG: hypothetical protein K2P86_07390 [Xanthobacteraceae bacterium]|nr:hypothetical protein [Xanthobacteraceae bacterium]
MFNRAIICAIFLLTTPALAVPPEVNLLSPIKPIGKITPRVKGTYLVSISCDTKGKISPAQLVQDDPFKPWKKIPTVSQLVVLSRTNPGSSSDGSTKIPSAAKDVVALVQLYSVSKTENNDYRNVCEQYHFISGTAPVYISSLRSESFDYAPTIFSKVVGALVNVVTPVWSLLGNIPALVTAGLVDFSKTQKAMDDVVASFNRTFIYPNVPRPLNQGTYEIDNQHVRVTIKVERIESIVHLTHPKRDEFLERFRAGLDNSKFAADKFQESCGEIYKNMTSSGVSRTADTPYALIWLAALKLSKTDMVKCLTLDAALHGLKLPDLWDYLPGRQYSEADVRENELKNQPTFEVVTPTMYDFNDSYNQVRLANGVSQETKITKLKTFFSPKFEIMDRTEKRIFANALQKMKTENTKATDLDFIEKLITDSSLNFARFGCWQPVAKGNGEGVVFANTAFLLFRGEPEQLTVKPNDVFLTFIRFDENRKVTQFLIEDEADWIKASLGGGKQCYKITVAGQQ